MDMTVSGEQHDTCSQTLSCWCGIKRFVSLTLFVAAVGILFCNIISRQDTKSTPTEPTIEKINDDLCRAGLGGPNCPPDDDSAEEVTCPTGQQAVGGICVCTNSAMTIDHNTNKCVCLIGQEINNECCPDDRVNGETCCQPGQHVERGICINDSEDPEPDACATGSKKDNEGICCLKALLTPSGVCCKPNQVVDRDSCKPKPINCLGGEQMDEEGNCCPTKRFLKTKGVCCPENAESRNGDECKCENQTMTYDPATNTCKSKTATSRLEHTAALWVLLAIIGAICIFLLVLFFTRSNDKAAQGVVGPQGGKEDPDSDREGHGEYQFEQGRDGEE